MDSTALRFVNGKAEDEDEDEVNSNDSSPSVFTEFDDDAAAQRARDIKVLM